MEEKRPKMEVVKKPGAPEKQDKLSYEQLENIAHQLSEQNRMLYQKLEESNYANAFKRLDYLFKVVEMKSMGVFATDFMENCAKEIVDILTLPEETPVEK